MTLMVNRKTSYWDCMKYTMKHQMPIKTFIAVGSIFRTFVYTPTRRFYDKIIQQKDHILNFKNLVSALKTCSVGVGSILLSPSWFVGMVFGAAIDSDFKNRFLELLSSERGRIFCTLFLCPIVVKGILLAYRYGHDRLVKVPPPLVLDDYSLTLPLIEGDINHSRVLFFPDVHDDAELACKIAHWICSKQGVRVGDVILSESVPFDEQQFQKDKDNCLIFSGWEDKDLCKDQRSKIFRWQGLKSMMDAEKQGSDLYNQLAPFCFRLHEEILTTGLEKRNDAMVKNIRCVLSKLDPKNRVFVIAGKLHINKRLLDQFPSCATVSFLS